MNVKILFLGLLSSCICINFFIIYIFIIKILDSIEPYIINFEVKIDKINVFKFKKIQGFLI